MPNSGSISYSQPETPISEVQILQPAGWCVAAFDSVGTTGQVAIDLKILSRLCGGAVIETMIKKVRPDEVRP